MTNEELVHEIQQGRTEYIGQLWEQVEKLIAFKARRLCNALEDRASIEASDLVQAGYFALEEAVKTYSQDEGTKFNTWLDFFLRTAFSETVGWRTQKQRCDPVVHAMSLSTPVCDKDGGLTEIGDFIADPEAATQIENVEERIFSQELKAAVKSALEVLTDIQKDTLHLRYYEGMTYQQIADRRGRRRDDVIREEKKSLNRLRRSDVAKHLRPFYDFDYYGGAGLGAFQRTGMSIEERYLMQKERSGPPLLEEIRGKKDR